VRNPVCRGLSTELLSRPDTRILVDRTLMP
jgi:hypothetical protein